SSGCLNLTYLRAFLSQQSVGMHQRLEETETYLAERVRLSRAAAVSSTPMVVTAGSDGFYGRYSPFRRRYARYEYPRRYFDSDSDSDNDSSEFSEWAHDRR